MIACKICGKKIDKCYSRCPHCGNWAKKRTGKKCIQTMILENGF